jgi:hypothetical protein
VFWVMAVALALGSGQSARLPQNAGA